MEEESIYYIRIYRKKMFSNILRIAATFIKSSSDSFNSSLSNLGYLGV